MVSYLITGQVPIDPRSQAIIAAGMLAMSSPLQTWIILLKDLSLDGLLLLLLLLLLRRVILRNAIEAVPVAEVIAVPADRGVTVHDQLLLLLAKKFFLRHLTQLRMTCA